MTGRRSGSKPYKTPNPDAWYKKIDRCVRKGRDIGLMIVRLGGYERLNAILGYSGCVGMFAQIYSTIKQVVPGTDVYRLSNLHFGCIIPDGMAAATDIAGQLADRLSCKFVIDGYKDGVTVPFNIIVADCPSGVSNAAEIEDLSRFVLDRAIGYNIEPVHIVSEDDLKWYNRRTEVEAAIERSIRSASFEVVYQPIIRVDNMKVYSVEALTRLRDERIGEILPDEFIPLAERLDVISYITEGVMSRSARLMSSGGLMELGVRKMHVNITGTECKNPDANGKLRGIIEDNRLDPFVMCLEISEAYVPDGNNDIGEGIVRLHESDMGIVLDDYGTGFSNMTGIVALPIDLVKIDRTFLNMALADEKVMIMLKDIIDMIHDMDRKVLVTGIENENGLMLMKEAGVDYAQGFYFSKPVTEEKLLEYVSNVNSYGMSPVQGA